MGHEVRQCGAREPVRYRHGRGGVAGAQGDDVAWNHVDFRQVQVYAWRYDKDRIGHGGSPAPEREQERIWRAPAKGGEDLRASAPPRRHTTTRARKLGPLDNDNIKV